MKKLTKIILCLELFLGTANAQFSGYIKNSAGQGLEGKIVEVCFHLTNGDQYNWNDVTDAQGKFSADQFTTEIDDINPENYKIDAPYPHPFNPNTIISVPVFVQGQYKLILFSVLGEQVAEYNGELERGIHKFSIKEPGAAGVYIYSFIGSEGIINSGKIVYLGGGNTASNIISYRSFENLPQTLNKITEEAVWLDSIIVRGDAIQKKTYPLNLNIPQTTYDVGDLMVDSAFVNINGRIYYLFDWQLQNNGVQGATVQIGNRQATTNADGSFNIQAPTGFQQMTITHPNIWTRKTKIVAYNDATIEDLNVMDKTRMPEDYLAFFDSVSSRIGDPARPDPANKLSRCMKTTNPLYIVADDAVTREKEMKDMTLFNIENIWKEVTKTPMYPEGFFKNIVIQTGTNPPLDFTDYSQVHRLEDDLGGPFALTFTSANWMDSTNQKFLFGEIKSSITKYWRYMPAAWQRLQSIGLHEQARGFMGLTSAIFSNKASIFNAGLDDNFPNELTEFDKRWILFTYSRFPGNRTPDIDYYMYNADLGKWADPLNAIPILDVTPLAPALLYPTNGSTWQLVDPTLNWNDSRGASSYTLQVSASFLFNTFVFNEDIGNITSKQITGLNYSTQYFWRVNATNSFGTSDWSDTWNFTTIAGEGTGEPCPGIPIVTYYGKTYNTVQIGTQCWLKENLDIGAMIPGNQNQIDNGLIEKYCYNNDTSNCNTYGALYEWDEAMKYVTNEGAQGICPPGWHIPTMAEYQTLSNEVGGDGNALKREDQGSGVGQGTNTSGFSALLAGILYYDRSFVSLGFSTGIWSSTQSSSISSFYLLLRNNNNDISNGSDYKESGYSVRCIKD